MTLDEYLKQVKKRADWTMETQPQNHPTSEQDVGVLLAVVKRLLVGYEANVTILWTDTFKRPDMKTEIMRQLKAELETIIRGAK